MFKYILICTILLLSCDNKKPKQSFPVSHTNDINEIVDTIVSKDSLYIGNTPIVVDLKKIKIYVPKSNVNIPPPSNLYRLDINDLIGQKGLGFGKKDSAYLLFQNDTLKGFRIEKSLLKHVKLTTQKEQEQLQKAGTSKRFFDFSIPIFSLDQKWSYVQVNNFCPFCGSGSAVFLEKINGKWSIIKQYRTWIN